MPSQAQAVNAAREKGLELTLSTNGDNLTIISQMPNRSFVFPLGATLTMRPSPAWMNFILLMALPLCASAAHYDRPINIITSNYDLVDTTYIDRGRLDGVRVGDRFQIKFPDGKIATQVMVTGVFDRMSAVKVVDSWLLKNGQLANFKQRPMVVALESNSRRPSPDIHISAAKASAAPAPAAASPAVPDAPKPSADMPPAAPGGVPPTAANPADQGLPAGPGAAADQGLPAAPGAAPAAPGSAPAAPAAAGAPDAGLPSASGATPDAGLPAASGATPDAGLPSSALPTAAAPGPDAGLPAAPGGPDSTPAPSAPGGDTGLPPAPADPNLPAPPM
jgi:hypothetical protein